MDKLDVNPRILGAFRKARITTAKSVLDTSIPDLVRTTKLSVKDVEIFVKAVSETVLPSTAVTALDLYTQNCDELLILRKLSLGCEILDRHLGGGILSQGITEISGVSASGKTQICLQLCLTVQLPYEFGGLEGSAVYISTEDVFPSKRLQQMIPFFEQKHKAVLKHSNVGDKVYIEHAADVETLDNVIRTKIPAIIKNMNVRLVVIDSIAALFRVEYSVNEMAERSKVLNNVGARLRQLSWQNNIPVVCVNQVSAVIDQTNNGSTCDVTPSLGLTWSNQVTVRIMLSRTTGVNENEMKKDADNPSRKLSVIFSPHLPNVTCLFTVDASGVHGVSVTD